MSLKDELIALGFPVGFPTRLNAAVRFLTDQEFTCIDDFMGAGAGRRLSALRGADLVQASDLAFLQSIKDNRAKKRLEGCAKRYRTRTDEQKSHALHQGGLAFTGGTAHPQRKAEAVAKTPHQPTQGGTE